MRVCREQHIATSKAAPRNLWAFWTGETAAKKSKSREVSALQSMRRSRQYANLYYESDRHVRACLSASVCLCPCACLPVCLYLTSSSLARTRNVS